ncbi:phosphoglycerate mutase (2,3-diphosphoglycerate-independent) [Acididesulfobacillus acetoxydans]|uniref:2,3-bisphosphoglycerate-independent phosphoglycerate mutase n=1 Tax=Acididesulfobacillus acetoxydans TaxID=1561005 RepID=A0A8S0X310_9FIRM|nr:2,3-bisphosphoglycerate-independent phosphoglycerate mutase [Acididesulfobacillus acetoxydans]CAA7599680.1 phosphoglycerate mutase (2,3-diphosphoglycerate-independent) [Acididesulfobacillus acetoxydans]CEJ06232.1 2,3-bisphosphoglycerate-independent phosphoglycerate mutase [Acididesulfobacillus acetoxydans]
MTNEDSSAAATASRRAKPLLLMILDGWGYSAENRGNAIAQAKIANFRRLEENYPRTLLAASGTAVGLPAGQMGNSEVGHLNIGAGRVVYQELTRIFKAIAEGGLSKNPVLREAMQGAKTSGKALHLMGLVSDGGVHSHIEHLFALLDMAKELGLSEIYIHAFLDGRDVLPQSAKDYLGRLENKLRQLGVGRIASVSGRYYAMDRDHRWERVEKGYRALASGMGETAAGALAAVDKSYDKRVTDEFVEPTVILDAQGDPVGKIKEGDSVIFFNFRADRARELTRAFVDETFTGFDRGAHPRVHFVCLTEYDVTIQAPVAFPPQNLEKTLGEVLSREGIKQLRIAETEKYAHVTFFFNGGVEQPMPGEERCLIPSPKVPTYNLQPEMSAPEVTRELLRRLEENLYDVIILNFANPDMVGHTGVFDATIQALEAVDRCIGDIEQVVRRQGGTLLITADHGNAEAKIDLETGLPLTAHTTNPVPFILVDERYRGRSLREGGALCDIAPTILELLRISQPPEMTGKSLLA